MQDRHFFAQEPLKGRFSPTFSSLQRAELERSSGGAKAELFRAFHDLKIETDILSVHPSPTQLKTASSDRFFLAEPARHRAERDCLIIVHRCVMALLCQASKVPFPQDEQPRLRPSSFSFALKAGTRRYYYSFSRTL